MTMKAFFVSIILLAVLFLSGCQSSGSCPLIDGVQDVNCDANLVIAGIGDSVVFGRLPDTTRDPQGGYLGRIASSFPQASIRNLGVPGLGTAELLTALTNTSCRVNTAGHLDCAPGNKNGRVLVDALQDADYIIVDVGRNDYFYDDPWRPSDSVAELGKISDFLNSFFDQSGMQRPFITFSYLSPVRRPAQESFVSDINSQLFLSLLPVYLHNDTLPVDLIGANDVHPTLSGYAELAARLTSFLKNEVPGLR